MKRISNADPVSVDIYWDPDCLVGVAHSVVDVLRMINQLGAMRGNDATSVVAWRWRPLQAGSALPRWLPTGPRAKALVADMAVVPGWHVQSGPQLDLLVQRSAQVIPNLQSVHESGGRLAFVYSATALGARAGLFDGVRAAVPWPFITATSRQSDQLQIETETAWTTGNRVWSCNSPACLTPMLLDLFRQGDHPVMGPLVDSLTHVLLPTGPRHAAALNMRGGMDGAILSEGVVPRTRRWLEANIDQPYDLKAMAEAVATSPRTLLRHFSQAYGCTPLEHLQGLRVARAQVLLETTYISVDQIAKMCGFNDTSTFRRVFMRTVGDRPSEYREHHRLRTSRKRWSGPMEGP